MEQNTTSQAAQKQGVKKKKSIKQKLLAFLKLAAPYLILCAIYGTLMLIFGPKESNSMELSIDVGTITLPGIVCFCGRRHSFAMYRRSAMPKSILL